MSPNDGLRCLYKCKSVLSVGSHLINYLIYVHWYGVFAQTAFSDLNPDLKSFSLTALFSTVPTIVLVGLMAIYAALWMRFKHQSRLPRPRTVTTASVEPPSYDGLINTRGDPASDALQMHNFLEDDEMLPEYARNDPLHEGLKSQVNTNWIGFYREYWWVHWMMGIVAIIMVIMLIIGGILHE